MRLSDVLKNFPFTTSETMHGYYLQTWYIRVASRVAERLRNDSLVSSLPAKMKILSILAKNSWKKKLEFSRSGLFHMETRVSLKYFVNRCRCLIFSYSVCCLISWLAASIVMWKLLNMLFVNQNTPPIAIRNRLKWLFRY